MSHCTGFHREPGAPLLVGEPRSRTVEPKRAPALSPLEFVSGVAVGAQPDALALPNPVPGRSARQAFEAAISRHLVREPCVVSFSGGRDSSAVLAVATSVARREGLPLPVPVTFRFSDVALSNESDWQERIIRHLGLEHWERIDLTTELDLLGDIARHCLTTLGLAWPPNAFLHVPIFRAARSGTVLTGLDGDGLFGDWRWCHAQAVLHRRVPAHWRDLVRVGFAFSPAPVRQLVMQRQPPYLPDWLSAEARHELLSALLRRAAGEPRRWDERVQWHARSRPLWLAMRNLDLIGSTDDVEVAHPLLAPDFLAALAAEGKAAGFGDRTSAMRHLFGDLLPADLVERRTKAVFGGAVWREQAIDFARTWSGVGFDPEVVDAERLRAAWMAEHPVFHSWTLLQAAWMAAQEK
jgi:asparagine synthase (glutamine-hydrolysing)